MVFSHPGISPKLSSDTVNLPANGRMGEHKFFLMLRAIRAYQERYQPKIMALNVNLIESRSLLVMSEIPGLDAEKLAVHVNTPTEEVCAALANLNNRGMVTSNGTVFALTESGLDKAQECWEVANAHADESFEDFTQDQIDAFTTVLKKLI